MVSRLTRLPIKVACKAGLAPRLLRRTSGMPVILMYHGVSNESREGLLDRDGKHIDVPLFRRHLDLLSKRRKVVPLGELTQALANGDDTRGLLAITFDDGYLDNIECAAPVLTDFKLCATFFLATGFIGAHRWAWVDRVEAALHAARKQEVRLSILGETAQIAGQDSRVALLRRIKAALKKLPWDIAETRVAELERELGVTQDAPWSFYRFMSWDQARQLASAGFEVGAHTVNHAILSRVPREDAQREILVSRDRVTQELGSCSATFCYPNGKQTDYTPDVMEICSRHFHTALSAVSGFARIKDRFELRRVAVDNATSPEYLASLILQAE
jgi:peptidoglycan/xylan/chitin deacetylase (PgdA/CDA1 family)